MTGCWTIALASRLLLDAVWPGWLRLDRHRATCSVVAPPICLDSTAARDARSPASSCPLHPGGRVFGAVLASRTGAAFVSRGVIIRPLVGHRQRILAGAGAAAPDWLGRASTHLPGQLPAMIHRRRTGLPVLPPFGSWQNACAAESWLSPIGVPSGSLDRMENPWSFTYLPAPGL